jgi:hypothetical protein
MTAMREIGHCAAIIGDDLGRSATEYARLAGMSTGALTAAMEPYLPVVRVMALLGGVQGARRERLIQRVEAVLCSEDG